VIAAKQVNPLANIKPMISRMEVAAIFLVIVSASCHPVVVNNRSHPAPNVENIDWKVIWFGNLATQETLERHEMYLRLRSDGRRMRAFDGCNGIWGNYRIRDEQLQFVKVGRTDWTCSQPREQRDALMKLLSVSSRWSVFGQHLDLYNTRGQLLIRFESMAEANAGNTNRRN
jgi:heat shock protein HslJ